MSNQEIAIKFIEYFCQWDIDGLSTLLTDDFKLKGPFYHFTSREDYLTHLRTDVPEKSKYNILNIFEQEDEVCVFYEYKKPQFSTTIAQLFKFTGDKIHDTLLVFDARVLTE